MIQTRSILLLLFLSIFQPMAFAQLDYVPAYRPPATEDQRVLLQARTLDETTPVQLPFWDDFSTSYINPDTSHWMDDRKCLISNSYGINPPTINVAVLDGADNFGNPYSTKISDKGLGDELVSRFIDLETVPVNERNSVYLSFFYQARGLGDKPERDDSIRLQFKASNNRWYSMWSKTGQKEDMEEFIQNKPMQVKDLDSFADTITFFHQQFQLRFQVFGNTAFSYDTWLLDYVYLDAGRNATDTAFFDRALYERPSSIFKNYYAVPLEHLLEYGDQLVDNISFGYYNLSNENNQPQEYWTVVNRLDENGGEINLDSVDIKIEINDPNLPQAFERRDITGSKFDFTQLAPFQHNIDTLQLTTKTYIRTADDVNPRRNLKKNDTIQNFHTIADFYAYDDGTAEFAIGIDKKRGRVAYRYVIPEPDTITGIDIYMPNYFNNNNALSMRFFVMSHLDNDPRSVLINQSFALKPTTGLNQFQRYNFLGFAAVKDTFYIGYEQQVDNYVAIGLDANADSNDQLFYSVDASGNWTQNFRIKKGSMMMRPVLGPVTVTGIDKPEPKNKQLFVYPNPGKGKYIIKSEDQINDVEVINLTGQTIDARFNDNTVEIINRTAGIYIFKITTTSGTHLEKVILNP